MEEQRKHARIKYEIDVEYDMASNQELGRARSRNLSEQGICLATTEFIETGSPIDISFYISKSNIKIDIKGIVIWNQIQIGSNKFLNGVKFTEIDESQRNIMRKFIDNMTFDAR